MEIRDGPGTALEAGFVPRPRPRPRPLHEQEGVLEEEQLVVQQGMDSDDGMSDY
jgi:hypothetical protein